ncbi:MAG: hypothetical protein IJ088_10860 [Clostridia bacterium]|nr:hypothetical protein [Clostridia bacterium]
MAFQSYTTVTASINGEFAGVQREEANVKGDPAQEIAQETAQEIAQEIPQEIAQEKYKELSDEEKSSYF